MGSSTKRDKRMSRIESVEGCWQRNHMTAGEGRTALPVHAARDELMGHSGTVAYLKAMAQPLADSHLVTVVIRTPQGNAHIVRPS